MTEQITFFGIVEDRQDPLEIGRVRVRCHGIHTDMKSKIATPDLPWAQVLLPTTSASLSGFGTQHGLVEGSTVYGFFRDGETKQDPVITHSAAGIPPEGYKINPDGSLQKRSIYRGFNDPRKILKTRKKLKDITNYIEGEIQEVKLETTYEDITWRNSSDAPMSSEAPNRPHGLTGSLDDFPKEPDTIRIDYKAKGSTITEQTLTDDDLPFYPLKDRIGESDLSPYARGDRVGGAGGKNIYTGPVTSVGGYISPAAPKYPFNKVQHSESGHVLEVDDTPGKERLSWWHRSGSFMEVGPDGTMATRVVNDNYSIICKDDEVFIGGKVTIHVGGDAKINVEGKAEMDIKKDASTVIGGDAMIVVKKATSVRSTENLTIVAPNISLYGNKLKLNS